MDALQENKPQKTNKTDRYLNLRNDSSGKQLYDTIG